MIPTNSSATTNGCDSISSNCVIWQGPDIACIDLCNGDTITEVVAKLAEKLCDILDGGIVANPDLTGLDLTCLAIPGLPPETLVGILQAMVNQICENRIGSDKPPAPAERLNLPTCLYYLDANGNQVTSLPINEYAVKTAQELCQVISDVEINTLTIANHTTRLNTLEACVFPEGVCVVGSGGSEAQVVPTCIVNVGNLTDVSVLLLALEIRFCELESAVGLPSTINNAISQSAITGSYITLSNNSVSYGSISGWNTNAVTLAQSMQNAWVVIDDMYNAITEIQTNCCGGGCDSVSFGYTIQNVIVEGQITGLRFIFLNSSMPSPFNDCAGSSTITITDVNSNTIQEIVSVSSLQNDPNGVQINLPGMNTVQDLSISIGFCVTDGTNSCSDTQTTVVTGFIPCPVSPTMSNVQNEQATISFINSLGPTAQYVLDVINTVTNITEQTETVNNPGASVTATFTNLIPNTNYNVRITINYQGGTEVCINPTNFTSTGAENPCTNGIDCGFIVDFTSSMSDEIILLKNGIPGVVNTIITESGSNDYQLGITLVDEWSTGVQPPETPYSDKPAYTSLPANQKIMNTGPTTNSWFTTMERFGINNEASFNSQIAPLATVVFPVGGGNNPSEPMDVAIGLAIEGAAFMGDWRPSAAKYLIIFTDNLPSGADDQFDNVDVQRLAQLSATCSSLGIRCFVMGVGNNRTYTPPTGGTIYPWRVFALDTGGDWNLSYNAGAISEFITNQCP
jgi:hypothetical protein